MRVFLELLFKISLQAQYISVFLHLKQKNKKKKTNKLKKQKKTKNKKKRSLIKYFTKIIDDSN